MTYEIEDMNGVILFTINRPEKHNAINNEVMEGFREVLSYIRNSTNAKFLIITGAGEQSFCSGGDLSEFHALKTENEAYEMLSKMGQILYELATLPIPTIALVNGTAVGGGCEIATACDFRILNTNAHAGFIQGGLAITSGWGGATYLMERGLRHDHAMKMLAEAKSLDAQSLFYYGWATQLYEGSEVKAIANFIEKMQKINLNVHIAYKQIMLRKWQQLGMYERVMAEIRECAKLWEKEEHHQAVNKFLNKTKIEN